MTLSSEDIKKIEALVDIRNRGFYASGAETTELYNRVLNKRVATTNCGSCIRSRITELESYLNKVKTELAKAEEQEKLLAHVEAVVGDEDIPMDVPTEEEDETKKTKKSKKK